MKSNNFFLKSLLEQGLHKALTRADRHNENEAAIRELITRVELRVKAGERVAAPCGIN